LAPDPQTIYRQLVVAFGQSGADALIQQMGSVSQSLQGVQQQAGKAGGAIKGFGKAAGASLRGVTALGLGISSTAVAMKTMGIDLVSSQRQLFEFNKGLLASRVLFAKYGENITQTRQRIIDLKNEYEFTRDELLSLQKQFQTGFTYLPVKQMTSYMRFLADATGETSSEMASLDQVFQGISQKMPIFEQMLRGNKDMLAGTGRDMLDAMFVTGQIGTSDYKQASGAIASAGAASRGSDIEQDLMREQLENVRRLITTGEDIQIEMATQLQPVVGKISSLVESNRDAVVKSAAISGNILRVVSVMGGFGAASGAMRILRGGQGANIMGRAANIRSGVATTGRVSRWGGTAGRIGMSGVRGVAGYGAASTAGAFGATSMSGAMGAGSSGLMAGVGVAGVTLASAFAVALGGLAVGGLIADQFIESFDGTAKQMQSQTEKDLSLKMSSVNMLRDAGQGDVADQLERKYEKIAELETKINKDLADRQGGGALSGKGWANAGAAVFGTDDFIERSEKALKKEYEMRDSLRRQASQMMVKAKDQISAQEEAMKNEQERQSAIERVRATMQMVTFEIERQDALVESQVSAYNTLIQLKSISGGASSDLGLGGSSGMRVDIIDDINKSISARTGAISALQSLQGMISERASDQGRDADPQSRIDEIVTKLKEAKDSGAGISEEFINSITQGLAGGIATREILMKIRDLQSEIGQKEVQRIDVINSTVKEYEGLESQARTAESLLGNQVQLAQNLAMGVGASASMIFQQVQAVERVIQVLQKQRSEMELIYQSQMATAEAAGNVELARTLEFQMTSQLLELDNKITAERSKQAGLSKTIRDGWVSAVSSMMTGEGMFTKIVVDQNTRLGGMMAATGNKTTGLRTGFAGRGFESSQRFVPGGINGDNSGITSGWQEALSSGNPLASLFSSTGGSLDPKKISEAMMEWQKNIGSGLGTGAAGAGGSIYGTSELLQLQTDHFKEWGSHGIKINADTPLPVSIMNNDSSLVEAATSSGKGSGGLTVGLNETDRKKVVDAVVVELTKGMVEVSKKASRNAVDDLAVGHSRL